MGIMSETLVGVSACKQLCLYRLSSSSRNTCSSGAVRKGMPNNNEKTFLLNKFY